MRSYEPQSLRIVKKLEKKQRDFKQWYDVFLKVVGIIVEDDNHKGRLYAMAFYKKELSNTDNILYKRTRIHHVIPAARAYLYTECTQSSLSAKHHHLDDTDKFDKLMDIFQNTPHLYWDPEAL